MKAVTTYPDADDARNMKSGSDHDRAEAWRIIAHGLRAENEGYKRATCHGCYEDGIKVIELRKQLEQAEAALRRIDAIVFDVPKTGDADSAVMDIARVIAEAG